MKKFMIFLLMAFLYLGTCQARSEASHPDNAKLKLLSWVTPTPSQSFLTRSADVTAIPDEVTVQIDGVHEGCANAQVVLTALVNYDQLSDFNFVWKVDGQALTPTTNGVVELQHNILKFDPEDLFNLSGENAPDAPVTHEFTVEVSYGDCSLSISPVHLFTVDPVTRLEIVFPTYACDGQTSVALTASLTNGVAPFQYKWFVENEDGTDTALTYANVYVIDTAVLAQATKVGVMGIFINNNCNSDTAWVEREDIPSYEQMHTLTVTGDNVICQGSTATMTASFVADASYSWAGPDPHAADTAGNVFKTTFPGVYSVTMTDNNGCTATAEFTIMQFGGDLQVTADQTTVCANTPVVLNANLDGFNNVNISYEWTKDGGAVIGNGSTITVTPTATTKYAVKATAGTACVMNDTIEITVTPTTNYLTVIYNNQVKRTSKKDGSYNVYSDQNDRLSYPAQYCEGQEIALYYVSDSRSTDTTASMLYNWFVDGNLIAENTRDLMIPAGMEIGSHYITAMAVVSGCNTATMSNSLNFIIHAAPEVTISGNNVICNGDTAFMTANATTMKYHPNSDVVYNHKYTWSNGKEFAVDTITTAGTYTVTATNIVSGKEMCSTTATVEVNVFGADLQLTADQMVVCAGEPVVLNANLDGFNNENVSYAWTAVGGSALGNGSTIQVNPTATTKYAVKATAGDCEMNDTINIVVSPGVHYTTTIAQTAQSVCLGDQTYFTATSEPAATYYEWYIDGVQVPGENLNNLMVTFDDLYLHYVKAKAVAASCDTSDLSNIAVVSVNRIPEISLTGNNVICNGDEAHITATVTNDDATFTYIWSNTTENNAELTATESGIYTVTVTNTISPNCSAVAEVNVTVFGSDLQITADKVDICAGEYVTINANIDGYNNENVNYTWTSDPASTIMNSSSIVVNPTQSTKYIVTAQAGDCSKKDSINIHVNAIPGNIAVAASPAAICEGAQDTIYVTGNNTADSYIWYQNGIEIPGQNLDTIIVTLNEAGSYSFAAKGVSNHGCVSESASTTPAVVTVNDTPEFTLTGNNIVCNGATATITATPADYTYTWSAGGEANVFTTTTAGTYSVTAANGTCTSVQTFNIYTDGADLQLTADKMEICEGDMVVLNANLEGFTNNNIAYAWSGDGLNATTGSTVSAVPTETGNVTYKVTAYTTGSNAGCTMKDSITITVHAAPAAVVPTLTTNPDICPGDQATLTAVTTATESLVYVWFQNGIQVPGENLNTITVNLNEPGTYDYSVIAFNQYGCYSNAAPTESTVVGSATVTNTTVTIRSDYVWIIAGWVLYDQTTSTTTNDVVVPITLNTNSLQAAQVTVHAAPDFTLTGNNIICNGATAEITATSNTDDTYTYAWSDGTTGATFTTTTAGTYSVTATDGTCTSVQTFNIYTTGADLQIIADNTVICDGEYVTLRANFEGFVNELANYTWKANGSVVGNGSNLTVNPSNSTTYVLTVGAGDCTISDSIEIIVHERPEIASITPSAEYICEGGQVSFTVAPASPSYTYEWYLNGIQLTDAGTSTLTLNFDYAGAYQVAARIINEYGCAAVNTDIPMDTDEELYFNLRPPFVHTREVTVPFVVKVLPTPEVQLSGNNIICDGSNAVITANVLPTSDDLGQIVANEVANFMNSFNIPSSLVNLVEQRVSNLINDIVPADFSYQYAWSNGATTQTLTTGTPGIYTVTVTNTAHGLNCYSTASVDIITSGSDLQVYADKMNVCEGEFVVLNANLDGFVNDNVTYTWTNEAGEVIGNVSTITVQTVANDDNQAIYTVTVNAGACEREASITINVTPVDTVYTTLQDMNTICVNNQITAIATTVPEAAATEFTWFLNGLELPGENQPTITLNMNEEGTYTLAAKAVVEGCTYAPVSEPVTFNVNNNPTVMITGDPIICEGNTVELHAQLNDTVPGMENYNYDWRLYNYSLLATSHPEWTGNFIVVYIPYFPYVVLWPETEEVPDPDDPAFLDYVMHSTAYQGTDSLVVSDLQAQDYPYIFTLVVTNEQGCRVASEPYYVYVNAEPTVVATVSDTVICANGEITATAHIGDNHQPGINYQWQYSYDGEEWVNIPFGLEPTLVTDMFDEDVFLRVVATQNGQGNNSGCQAISDSIFIHVITPKKVSSVVVINNGQLASNVCEGAQLEITAKMVDEEGVEYIDSSYTYMWELNGMQLQTIHGPQFSAQAYIYDSDPVDYVYTAYVVLDVPGCMPIPVSSDTVHVRRNPIVTIDGNPNVCYYGPGVENVVLTAWVDGVVDLDATYTWYESGQFRPNPSGFDNNYRESWVPTYENPYIFTVEVTNGDGCTTISDPFYVNVYEKPAVNITGDAEAICVNGNVTLQANLNNYNDPMLTFQWYENEVNNTHILSGATHEVETFQPVVNTNYIVMVTHLMDFNTQYCVAYDTFQVAVNEIPVVTAVNDLGGNDTICEGRSITMVAGIVDGGVEGGEVYTWYRNGEVIENFHDYILVDAPVAIDNEPTSYVYAVKVQQSASGCESEIFTFEDAVVVFPNPTLQIATQPIVCEAVAGVDNVTLTANIYPEVTTDLTYRWFEDNVEIAGVTGNVYTTHKDFRTYPYNFSVQTVNEYGCVSEATAQVYVNDSIIVNITASEDSICLGGNVTLNAALDNWNADMLTFQWFDNGEPIPGATTLEYAATPDVVGNHNYSVVISQLTSGCVANSSIAAVFVNAVPEVTAEYANLDATSICDGRTVVISASVVAGTGVTGGEIYTWYRNDEVIEGVNGSVLIDNPMSVDNEPMVYHYAVSVRQAASGCESEIYHGLDNITVNPNPTIALVADPIVCVAEEGNVVLTANVFPTPVTEVSYLWFEDNDTITTTSANTLTLTKPYRDYPYSFSVMLVNDYGCQSIAEAQVSVNDTPVVNITATEYNICVGGEITLSATLNDWNADMLTFQWSDNGQEIPGATMLHYTVVPTEGTHNYTLTVNQLTSGCVGSSNTVEVVVNPIPVITGIEISNTNICNGGQISVTATLADVVDGEVFTWFRNGVLMEGATAATIYDTPGTVDNNIQNYVYSAYVTRPAAGCVSAPVTSAMVTVYPNPTPVITGDQHVCETDSVFLIANVDTTGMATGSLHYTWYESGQIRDNMGYNLGDNRFYAEYLYARTEPYRFTVEVSRNTVENGCSATSAEYLVYVYPQPVVNITATETTICENGQVTLTANLNDYNAENITYQWYTLDVEISQIAVGFDNNGNYVYDNDTALVRSIIPGATSATYTTSLTETTILGVEVYQTNSTCSATDEILINVNPIPVITSVVASDESVCNGAEIYVAASTDQENDEEAVYTWYRNGFVIEGATLPIFAENVYTIDNQVTINHYTVIATFPASGCVSAMSADEATVIVNPAPSTVTITGNNVICEGSTTTLHAYSDVEGTFVWSNGVQGVDSIVVPAGSYTVTMMTAEGCEMTSAPFNVEAFGTDLLVSASQTSVCEGEHVTLYVNQDGWQGNVTYLWDSLAGNSTATTVDVQPFATTTYHVTATVSSTNGTCSQEGEVTIVVHPAPTIDSVTVSDTLVCEGTQVTFTAYSTSTGDAFIWYVNGFEIPGENQTYLTYNFNEAGEYNFAVKAISDENCISAVFAFAPTVTVKPAPSQVSISGDHVICFGSTAELVAHADVEGTFTWSNGMTGDTVHVPAGVYNVTVTTPEGCSMTSPDFTVESFGTDLIVTATSTNICEGDHTTLSVDQNGWQGDVTYTWSTGSHATSIDVAPVVTTTYYVTATVVNEAGACEAVGEITINVNPRPAAPVVMVIDTMLCVGSQVAAVIVPNFDETPTPSAYLNSSYVWYLNGVEIPGENNTNIIVNAEVPGSYIFTARAISQNGCISDISNMITDHSHTEVIPAPESVVINGNSSFCNGGSTILYATVSNNTYLNSPYQITYTWYKDNVAMNIASTDHITVTEAGSYKVVATNMGLCSTESNVIDVTVAEAPQMQLTATETEICVGGTTVITAEATGWNNSDVNYNWNNGFQGSAYTFNATTAGVETFIVTASQSTSGCVATDTINITVNAIPATPVVNVDNATVCDGGQVTLQVANAVQGATYTWYRNGSVIANATQATILESPIAVDGDATVYVYNVVANLPMSGCESAMSANTIVTVIPTPVATVSVDGNTTFCQGGNTTLNVNVTPAAAYTYQWYKDNVLIEGATEASYIVNEVARETAYEFTVVVSANAGCNVTAAAPAINVLADPTVTATISNDIVCVGGVATLTATVEGGVAGVNGLNEYTYQWYRNTPTESNQLVATGETYTTTGTEAAGNYSYWVVINNGYNCNALSTPVNFSVVELPVVTIARVAEYDATVCDGGETAIKANVTGGYGEISYQWYKNGNLMPGENNQVLNIAGLSYGVNDTYTVEVTQTGVGCSNSASAAINTLVTVNPAYTVDITGFGNVCEGGTLTLTATVNNVIAGDVLGYQWFKIMNGQNAPINGATSATYSTSDLLLGNSYEYFVVVYSNMSGCTTISSTVPANVVSAPSVTIQGANTVCEGGNLTLNAIHNGGVDGAAYTYTWNWTGAATGTAVTSEPSFVPTFTANDLATPYYVTVTISRTDNTGCTATSAAHEVNVLAVPTVSVTADNAFVCQNGDVTLTAHVSPVGAYNYVWTINGEQQAVNAATVTTSMATVGAINATVVVSAANASASCSATATLAAPVQVVAAPSVTIAADHTTMCVGGTTTLTANVAVNGNIPADFSYQWAINGIEVDGAVANTFVQPLNAAGVYTYTLRVSQNNNLGCNSTWSAPVTVQVAEQPVVALSSVDGLNICEGGSITLTGTVTNYGNTVNGVTNSNIYGAMTFDWTRNGANVHQDANVNTAMKQFTETLNTIGNYNYTVTVDAAGYNCQPQVSNVETISVVGNPSWTDVHVYSNNGTDACLGEMVYLMAAIQGGVSDGATSTNGHIQWVVTDQNGNTVEVSGGLGGNSYDVPATAGTYVYTPTFVGNIGSGCQLTNTGDVQVGVTVHELPTAEFVGGSSIEICANDASASAELVINFTGVAPFVYEVVDDNNNVVAHATTLANTATIYVSPSEQTTYRISLVQDAFCENTALDASAVVTVYVNEVTFDQNIFVSGCQDNGQVTVFFNVISGDPTAAFNVVYEYGATYTGNVSNGTATFPAPTVPGDYNATITIDGCSYDIIIRVLVGDYGFGGSLPIMDIRWNDVVTVNNNPETNGGHTFVGFQWYHNGVAIPGATYSNYQDKEGLNGFYSVELIEQDANGNMITYRTCEMYFNGVSTVKVYPVPANVRQEITIELDLTSEQLEGAVLDIYSVTGAHISHLTDLQPITKIEGFKAQGTYFGRILTGTNEIKTVKFVIVK